MIKYFNPIKVVKNIQGEILHLEGSNNWKQVGIFYGVLFIIGLSLFYFFSQYLNDWSIVIRIIPVLIVFFITFISFNTLIEMFGYKTLEYLIFNKEGIRLNHSKKKTKEHRIPISKIKKLRIVVANSLYKKPTFRIYINHQEKPITSFDYSIPENKKLNQLVNDFTSSLGLQKTLVYRLTSDKILFEYQSKSSIENPKKILPVNFESVEEPPKLIFNNIKKSTYHTTLDFETGKLTAYSNLFYTVDIDLKDVSKFESSINVIPASSENEGYITAIIYLTNNKGKQFDILKSKTTFSEEPSDILEFDCSIELDKIVNRLNKIKN